MFNRYSPKLFVSLVLLVLSAPSFATNGIYLIGFGAKSRAMGGVGIGYTPDAIANQLNPAGITSIDIPGAMRLDLSMMYFAPKATVTIPDPRPAPNAGNPIEYDSKADQFLIPAMGAVYKFNRKIYMGFSFVGAGGGGTRYTRLSPLGFNFFNPAGRTDVGDTLGMNFAQAQMAMTVAYMLNKRHTVAVSPVIGIQTFRAFGLGVFKPFSAFPDNLSNKGNDWAYGAGLRLGWQGELTDWLRVGAAYTSKIYFTEFDKYKGTFAEQGNMDNPQNIGLGLSLDLSDNLVLAFDWQRVYYSDVAAIGTPIEVFTTPAGFLGADGGAGFGWEDQDIYKLGLLYQYSPKFDLMLGFNYGKAPMPSDQLLFSAIAPAVTEKHITAGITYRPDKKLEWTFTFVHALQNKESGVANSGGQFDNFFPNATETGPGDMALEMEQNSAEVSFTFKM